MNIFKFSVCVILSLVLLSCGDSDKDKAKNLCKGGDYSSLQKCIEAKIELNVDDICDCKTSNYPKGPWYLVPDDDRYKTCVSGTWKNLSDCIKEMEEKGLMEDCECDSDNGNEGPWYMKPD